MFIDTHAHIYLSEFKKDIEEVLDKCTEARVNKIFMPNIDETSIDEMLNLEEKFPEKCISMIGLHPCSVDKNFDRQLYLIESWIESREFAAIGEIGTDLYWDNTFWEQQLEVLRIQLAWAKQKGWPVVIHCREALDETIEIIGELNDENLRGIFHCFTGTEEQAEKITGLGFYLGIGGVSTFKNGGLEGVLKNTELKHLVLETDSPYLAPVPHRGKRNEPGYIPLIASRIAELKDVDINEVAKITTENAKLIFADHAL